MRTRPWIHTILSALLVLVLGLAPSSSAATPPPADPQAVIQALTKANAAVVGVQVTAADGARSAETLGKERRGSGVVIGPDGLILTIGYLMVEAQTIEVVTQDNSTVPAQPVAYDIATGFGLIRSLLPLRGIAPTLEFILRDGARRSYSMANAPHLAVPTVKTDTMPAVGPSVELHIRHIVSPARWR